MLSLTIVKLPLLFLLAAVCGPEDSSLETAPRWSILFDTMNESQSYTRPRQLRKDDSYTKEQEQFSDPLRVDDC